MVVPARFVDFAASWCGVDWAAYPAQRLVAGVSFDGEPIPDTPMARALFGGALGEVPRMVRRMLVAVCGRRGGKTYTLISLRLLHLALTCDVSMVRPGQRPVALVIAPNEKLRQEAVNYALGAARAHPSMRQWLQLPRGAREDDVFSEFAIRRPHDGVIVSFEGGVATAGGYGGRGRALVGLALDEVAFFRDKSSKVNDEDILNAASKAVLPGGQIIIASSPWSKRGVLWERYTANVGKPTSAIAVHAPTTLLNPAPWIAEQVEAERARDPDAARHEYDAEFLDAGTTAFFDDALIESCIDDALNDGRMPNPGELVRAGGDTGLRSDSATLAIGHLVGTQILTGELVEMRPEPNKPLKPSEVAQTFRARCDAHGVTYYTADGHYWDAVLEYMGTIPCAQYTGSPDEAFVRARSLMRQGRVRIPRNDRLLRQLREVEGRPKPGGGIAITMPRWRTGGHGDIAQALVLMLSALGGDVAQAPTPKAGTPEWEAADRERRRAEYNRRSRDNAGWAEKRFR